MEHTPPRPPTRLHRAIDRNLGRPLAELVATRRAQQAGWRAIANEVEAETGIEVSHEALRDWFGEPAETAGGAK